MNSSPQHLFDQALAHHTAGRWDEAGNLYRQVVQLHPHHRLALVHLGIIYQQKGDMDAAIDHFMRALRLAQGPLPQPLIATEPQLTWNLMGIACHQLGHLPEALVCYQQALAIQPNYPAALSNYGFALMAQGKPVEATEPFNRALELQPDFPEAHSNLGTAWQEQDRYLEAEHCFRTAIRLQPTFAHAWYNLGLALQAQGNDQEALKALRQAHQLEPGNPETHLAESLILLRLGEYEAGWIQHEWRWKTAGFHHHGQTKPLWDRSPLVGRTLLLHCEQGFGDSIQLIRYAPLVKSRGGTIVVQCPPALYSLFKTVAGVDHLVTNEHSPPPCDFQTPLLSLPRIMGTTLATIPNSIPYLGIDPQQASFFHDLAKTIPNFKIGLSWRGNPKHKNDRNRSIHPRSLAQLADLKGISLISLQKIKFADDLEAFSGWENFYDWGIWLNDFSATAAAIAALDLVIAVDSAVIHLAGALGHPAWVLLPMVADWRWGFDGENSPWYPSVRQFRQPQPGAWDQVIASVKQHLHSTQLCG
ncbi:MAG TPA: tetratricopeptide repeat protein [Magnetococcales bacterium]|nr:tetratricopeptide repeat protein [Magnetococcales bacterium]